MICDPLLCIDFYKADHRRQYPEGTTEVYSNFTARSANNFQSPHFFSNEVVFFGLQYFILDYLYSWRSYFFNCPIHIITKKYKSIMDHALGKDVIPMDHIIQLHELGYLPLKIKALPEGSLVPIGVPMLTIVNTHPDFFWLVNYIETILSSYLWLPITSATIAHEFKKILSVHNNYTNNNLDFVPLQAHDFSFRGMSSLQSASISGAAHLLSFLGTDVVPAIQFLKDYYSAKDEILIGCSVPATEHSVMCMGSKETEIDTFKRLITDIYPSGIVSIVADTWDFWKVITEYLPILKPLIMTRNGKVVIRPDSGNPYKIICGDSEALSGTPQSKGAIQCLWEIFGGERLPNGGYCQLDSHIGLIYGDSITLQIAQDILTMLRIKGFAASNIVFGIGSYTYQYNTRDTFGFAVKATSGIVNGERRNIFKDPKTDNGTKKSAKGLLRVTYENGKYVLYDEQTEEQEATGYLRTVFLDGKIRNRTDLYEIRTKLKIY